MNESRVAFKRSEADVEQVGGEDFLVSSAGRTKNPRHFMDKRHFVGISKTLVKALWLVFKHTLTETFHPARRTLARKHV